MTIFGKYKLACTATAVALLWAQTCTSWADQHQLSMDLMLEDQLQADHRQHSFTPIPLETITGNRVHSRYSAFGLDNTGLERAANDLNERRMPDTHQLLNHHWLYVSSHDFKWTPGSDIVTVYLKSKARDYWSKVMHTRQQKRQSQGRYPKGKKVANRMIYDMGVDAQSVEFQAIYRFH